MPVLEIKYPKMYDKSMIAHNYIIKLGLFMMKQLKFLILTVPWLLGFAGLYYKGEISQFFFFYLQINDYSINFLLFLLMIYYLFITTSYTFFVIGLLTFKGFYIIIILHLLR